MGRRLLMGTGSSDHLDAVLEAVVDLDGNGQSELLVQSGAQAEPNPYGPMELLSWSENGVLERLWNEFGTTLERPWNDFGTSLERVWNDFGTSLERVWYENSNSNGGKKNMS